MPQLDLTIIFSQIFWLILVFSILYSFLLHFLLPKFLISIKARKAIIYNNSSKISLLHHHLEIKQKFIQNKLLTKLSFIRNEVNHFWLLNNFFQNQGNLLNLDKKISFTLFNLTNYHSLPVLKSLTLYSKSLNLKSCR
uniref:ATP synthase F0 subunit 8 n=1 Tax=Gastroclonium compressum TaxID=1852973 RepID=A0A173FZR3_GASCM|nr:ATP synthase F0 subunit 8 [Coeloseira compressa]